MSGLASSHNRGDASADSLNSAEGQFNAFMVWLHQQTEAGSKDYEGRTLTPEDRNEIKSRITELYGVPVDGGLMPPDSCTYHALKNNGRIASLKIQDWDRFACYLATFARQRKKGCEHLPLRCNTADRYLSAIKQDLITHGYNNSQNSPLDDAAKTKKVRDGMWKIFIERHRKEGMYILSLGLYLLC